mgnify:CR=1 FL=1
MRRLLLLLLCSVVACSPFWELNDSLQKLSGAVSLKRSTLPGKELGVFAETPLDAFSPCVHVSHENWIDPYGMLQMKPSDVVAGSIQEQIWKELLIGRPGSGRPLLMILNKSMYNRSYRRRNVSHQQYQAILRHFCLFYFYAC